MNSEEVAAALRDIHVEAPLLLVVTVEVGEGEDHVIVVRRAVGLLVLGDREDAGLGVAVAGLVEVIAVGAAEGGAERAGLVESGIDGPELVEAEVTVGGGEDGLEGVVVHELGNGLAEVQLVAVEAKVGGDAQFLAVEDHRRAVHGAASHVADERLEGVGVALLVVRNIVEQNHRLAVSRASRVEVVAIIACGGGVLKVEDEVFVEHVEVAVGTVGHIATVQRLGHEHKIPFPAADLVDEVFPALRRQPLPEIRAQAANAPACRQVRRRVGRTAGLVQPIKQTVGEIAPDVLCERVEMAVAGAGAAFAADGIIEPVGLAQIIAGLRGIGHQRGVTAGINVGHVRPFAEVVTVRRHRLRRRAGGALVVFVGAGIKQRLVVDNEVGRLAGEREQIRAEAVQLAIPSGVAERFVQHHIDAGGVGGGDEVGEFLHPRGARVGFAQQRIDLEEVFDRIRTADGVRQAGVRIDLPVFDANRMDRLEPEPVHPEVLNVFQIEPVGHRVVRPRAGAVV